MRYILLLYNKVTCSWHSFISASYIICVAKPVQTQHKAYVAWQEIKVTSAIGLCGVFHSNKPFSIWNFQMLLVFQQWPTMFTLITSRFFCSCFSKKSFSHFSEQRIFLFQIYLKNYFSTCGSKEKEQAFREKSLQRNLAMTWQNSGAQKILCSVHFVYFSWHFWWNWEEGLLFRGSEHMHAAHHVGPCTQAIE